MDAAGNMATYSYDGAGRLLTTTDPNGNTTTNTYDAAERMTKIINADRCHELHLRSGRANRDEDQQRRANNQLHPRHRRASIPQSQARVTPVFGSRFDETGPGYLNVSQSARKLSSPFELLSP